MKTKIILIVLIALYLLSLLSGIITLIIGNVLTEFFMFEVNNQPQYINVPLKYLMDKKIFTMTIVNVALLCALLPPILILFKC